MAKKNKDNTEYVYVLRTCNSDLTSYNGFKWPEAGIVEAPDWQDNRECGNGLHGLLWGIGDGALLNWAEDAKWLVVKVPFNTIIDLQGKIKFPQGEVIFAGDKAGAVSTIIELGADPALCVSGTATAGVRGTATAGDYGTATAGDDGTIIIKWHDGNRFRFSIGYIGEDGLKKNVQYKCDKQGKFVEVKK